MSTGNPPLMPERYPTWVTNPDGSLVHGELEAWEVSPLEDDCVQLTLILPDLTFGSHADHFFSALQEIRRELEKSGRLMENYGSSLHVYPSPMCLSMGSGERAYRLAEGKQAKSADLVSIFETGADVVPSRVEDQERFYQAWLRTLTKPAP